MTIEKIAPSEIRGITDTIGLKKLENHTSLNDARKETEQYLRRLGKYQRDNGVVHTERVRIREEYFNSLPPKLSTWLQEELPDGRIRSSVLLSEEPKAPEITKKPSRGMAKHIRREKAKGKRKLF